MKFKVSIVELYLKLRSLAMYFFLVQFNTLMLRGGGGEGSRVSAIMTLRV